MSNPIIDKSLLQCNKGTKDAPLQVTSQSFVSIAGRFQATEEDKQGNTNIAPFGLCKLKSYSGGYRPCVPALIKWQNTSPFDIDGKKELTTESFCSCSTGGIVTPLQDDASSFEEIIDKLDNVQGGTISNNSSEDPLVNICPEDGSQCFNYADVVPSPQISTNWGNKNKNRFKRFNRGTTQKTRYHFGPDIHTGYNNVDVHSLLCGEIAHIRNSFVTNKYQENSLGNLVVVKSKDKEGKNIYIMYCHLDKVYVKKGDKVKHGQKIALSGSTGNASDGSLPNGVSGRGIKKEYWHIHIEASREYVAGSSTFINVAKSRVDPELFMKTKFDNNGNAISN